MATVKNINKSFCDDVFTELSGMKTRIEEMRGALTSASGITTDLLGMFQRHLGELADQIDWKLQILSHACPYDWKGSDDYAENIVSVGPVEKAPGADLSAGYLGG